jgi:antirestriction protein ArdC
MSTNELSSSKRDVYATVTSQIITAIAELGAAFTCAHLGLSTEPREDHAEYIQSWLRVLKADKRAIFTAATKAQQAADYLVKWAGRLAEVAA